MCREELRTCGLVLLLQAYRRGWVPGPEQDGDGTTSVTALELQEADRTPKVDVLCFLSDKKWPGDLWEDDAAARAWVKNFRDGLNRNAKFFRSEDDPTLPGFRALVSLALANHRNRVALAPQPADADVADIELRRVPPEPEALPDRPYPLLGPYEDPRTFAGRDAEIESLTAHVRMSPLLLAVHAPSGAGKSSLLLAGLAPRLRKLGYAVSVERTPGDAGLARRLVNDVLDLPPAVTLADADPVLPSRFTAWVEHAYRTSGKPVVFVLDQIDDVLRDARIRNEALARIGPLIAATAQRLPGAQGFACKWVLCYRHEFHGQVREWLQNVLAEAQALKRGGIDDLPHDVSHPLKSHDWPLPVLGKPAPGDQAGAASQAAFRRAILQPLELRRSDGSPAYDITMSSDNVDRLARAFAGLRAEDPEAPLLPELQVVLNHLIARAREKALAGGRVTVEVPEDEPALRQEIERALADHLKRALTASFVTADPAAARAARSRALLALGHLADAEGRRKGAGLPTEDFVRMLDPNGRATLATLSSPDVRLVVERQGACALAHDRLAEVVTRFIESDAARRDFDLDERVVRLRRFVEQRSDLYHRSKDQSALRLTRGERETIDGAQAVLLADPEKVAWWEASAHLRDQRVRTLWTWGAAATIALLVGSTFGYRAYQGSRREALRTELVQVVSGQEPDAAKLVPLLIVHDYPWEEIRALDAGFVTSINPELFASAPMEGADGSSRLLDLIKRAHALFVSSRPLFGAMSFAVEEVWLRAPEGSPIRERARVLQEEVRAAFINYHKEKTTGFRDPPTTAAADSLNPMMALPAGRFEMGRADVGPNERPVHSVQMSPFSMQQHEVTNDEYRRFDPAHTFPAGEGLHPVANVSWYEAAAYAAWLGGALSTEAQWEYAARGTGTTSGRAYPWEEGMPDDSRAVFEKGSTEPVGSRIAGRTPDGLDDMAGNVWEWCRDLFGDYGEGSSVDPLGPTGREADAGPSLRVLRGGSFLNDADFLRAALRLRSTPDNRNLSFGFRVVSSRLRP